VKIVVPTFGSFEWRCKIQNLKMKIANVQEAKKINEARSAV